MSFAYHRVRITSASAVRVMRDRTVSVKIRFVNGRSRARTELSAGHSTHPSFFVLVQRDSRVDDAIRQRTSIKVHSSQAIAGYR